MNSLGNAQEMTSVLDVIVMRRKSGIKLSGVAIAKVDLIDAYLVQLDA